jgi:Ca2+-binding EF-hand superfamily protein
VICDCPQKQQHKIVEVFKEFDLDGNGVLNKREIQRLIERLMPELKGQDM